MTDDVQPPVRVCCMQRHNGPVCPDGTVMCCICFEKFTPDPEVTVYDVCPSCEPRAL